MIDLHTHILPGLDDGAGSWEESLKMARMAVEDGIDAVVCTPHWVTGFFENTTPSIMQAVETFRKKLESNGIPLSIYPGSELRLDFELIQKLESGEILTINDTGRYALIELPEGIVPQNMRNFFWELQSRNITPIISHPERNHVLLRNPDRLYRWVETGVLTQLTAASLLGRFGNEIRKFSILLLEHEMAHILSSDAHGARQRTPKLSEGLKEAERIVGEKRAQQMVLETPRLILEGQAVSPPNPVPLSETLKGISPLKRFLSIFSKAR
jgi:protein-tyrosine phosphatase